MENYQEIDEINLLNLIFYCLKRWRCIFICMVLLAIIAGFYKYQSISIDNHQPLQLFTTDSIEEETEGKNTSVEYEDPISLIITFAVIGMVGGACLICFVFCISYICGGKLQDGYNFQQRFGMPLLGDIRKNERKKRIFGFIDQWIRRLEEGPYVKISRKEQIKIAVVNVRTAIQKNTEKKIQRVMLVGTIVNDDVLEICEELKEEIEDVSFSPYRQIIFHASALKKLEYYEGILFIEKKGESYEKLICQEKMLALDRNVKVLGVILC